MQEHVVHSLPVQMSSSSDCAVDELFTRREDRSTLIQVIMGTIQGNNNNNFFLLAIKELFCDTACSFKAWFPEGKLIHIKVLCYIYEGKCN